MNNYPNPYQKELHQYPMSTTGGDGGGGGGEGAAKLQWRSMEEESMNMSHNLNNTGASSSSNNRLMFEEEEEKSLGINKKGSGGLKIKKHKFAFQTRSQVDILDDGYRWRKYGQKAVKNNNFPRSYYKCTSQGCSVKKQVQRHARDEGIVVTTYEGVHTHHIEKPNDNFENILNQMQIYAKFDPL